MTRPTAQSRPRPMRQTKLKTLIKKPTPSPTPPSPHAGNRLFFVPEIRQAILSQLPKPALARMMRVHRGCIREVAELLYHSVDISLAQFHLDRRIPRRAVYCDAVTTVNARTRSLYTTMGQRQRIAARRGCHAQFEGGDDVRYGTDSESDSSSDSESQSGCDTSDEAWDPYRTRDLAREYNRSMYSSKALRAILPPLRRKLPHLRQVNFGCEYRPFGDPRWSVTLHPPPYPLHNPQSLPSPAPFFGQIDLVRTRNYDLTCEPPDKLISPPPPSSNYIVRERFDLNLFYPVWPHAGQQETLHEEWLDLLRDDPLFGDLYLYADFGEIRVDLELLGGLYERQIARGHTELLQHIWATDIEAWSVPQFRTFAQVASTSLRTLILCDDHWTAFREDNVDISFVDLPELVSIVRAELPKLQELRLPIEGGATAEQVCKLLLSADNFDKSGSITSLHIITDEHVPPLFNVLRVLAPMCAADASVHVAVGDREKWNRADQTMFHRYIQSQPAERRLHLSTVLFDDIKVLSPWDIFDIRYDKDGKPIHRYGPHSILRAQEAVLETHSAMSLVMEGIENGEIDMRTAVKIIQGWHVR